METFTRAPLLDLWVALSPGFRGWARPHGRVDGFAGALVGEMITLGLWCSCTNWHIVKRARGPRIVKFLIAPWADGITSRAVGDDGRIAGLLVYPHYSNHSVLAAGVAPGFPKYKQSNGST